MSNDFMDANCHKALLPTNLPTKQILTTKVVSSVAPHYNLWQPEMLIGFV